MRIPQYLSISILALSASAAHAGGYVGAAIGQTNVDTSGFEDPISFSFTGGYRIHNNFAIEGSYINLGESEDDFAPIWTLEADGLNFSIVGIAPINEQWEVFGKLGMFMWDVTLDAEDVGRLIEDDGSDISYGFGVSLKMSDALSLAAEYQAFDVDDVDISNISLGVRFSF